MSRRQAIEYLQLCNQALVMRKKQASARLHNLYRLKRADLWQAIVQGNPLTNAIDTFKNNKGGSTLGNIGLAAAGFNPLGMMYNGISGLMGGTGVAGLFNKQNNGNKCSKCGAPVGTTAPSTSGSNNVETNPSVKTTQPGTTATTGG